MLLFCRRFNLPSHFSFICITFLCTIRCTLHFLGMNARNNVRAIGFSWIFPFIPYKYLCYFSTLFPCKPSREITLSLYFPASKVSQGNYFVKAFFQTQSISLSKLHKKFLGTSGDWTLSLLILGNCLIHSAMVLRWKTQNLDWF